MICFSNTLCYYFLVNILLGEYSSKYILIFLENEVRNIFVECLNKNNLFHLFYYLFCKCSSFFSVILSVGSSSSAAQDSGGSSGKVVFYIVFLSFWKLMTLIEVLNSRIACLCLCVWVSVGYFLFSCARFR